MKTEMKFTETPEVKLIAATANDVTVLEAMLVSTDPQIALDIHNEDPEASAGRIRFLMKNRHGTPFEHNHFKWFIKAPIFVFREFHRHRIGFSYNEQSGRYSQLEPEFWIPDEDRPLVQVGKPGHYIYEKGSREQYINTVQRMTYCYRKCYEEYEAMLENGVAKEVARAVLPVALYSSMYVTTNARALMSFLSLRTNDDRAENPSTPMREIEQVARAMEANFAEFMPLTYNAFNDFGRVSP